jgi:hypothetical protein
VQPTRDRAPARVLPVCAGLGLLAGALLAGAAGIVPAGGAVLADAGAQPVQVVADVAVAVVLVAVLPRAARTRLWAAVLLVPATWLAGRGLAVLAALLG